MGKTLKRRLISLVNDLWIVSEKYEEQIYRAIEIVEELINDNSIYYVETLINDMLRNLLDILKGSDKDEKE